MSVSIETENCILRKVLENAVNRASRLAESEQSKARMVTSLGALSLFTAAAAWLLGAQEGSLVPLVVGCFCGAMALEPWSNYRSAAAQIEEIEDGLLRESMTFEWTNGKVPRAQLKAVARPEKEIQ